jgi:S-adenosylmethionine:diacylglycerol 3-amino-3-carboxypropyl transferase
MHHLYDFGISQEDPLTEFNVLEIQDDDRVLCVASAGEVPLSLLYLQPGAKITAVDISIAQLALCRLKLQAAIALPFPLNGRFLGYAPLESKTRREIYFEKIHPSLTIEDRGFWSQHLTAIEKGVINFGRFEGYIKRLRKILSIIIGKKNLQQLINCSDTAEQQAIFDKQIAGRKAVKYLFRVAFHPAIYKNRGLSPKGLMHARANTGKLFLNKFRNFCTATPAKKNYFLQYFLMGECTSVEAFPEYLRENSRGILVANRHNLTFREATLQEELAAHPAGTFNKIHLSNIGDWMSKQEFYFFVELLHNTCTSRIKLCYRFLQKNHFEHNYLGKEWFDITPVNIEMTDRFPFYNVLSIQGHG